MIFIFGKRDARVGRYLDTEHICYRCKAFDREVTIWQPYFQFSLIPFFPLGPKVFEMRCLNCGDGTRLESVLQEYKGKNRPAIYLWSGTILFALLGITWFSWHDRQLKQTTEFLLHPAPGDVYTLEENTKDGTSYSFLLVARIKNDSVFMLANKTDYLGFVSDLADDDYFVAGDTLGFPKKKLLAMREDDQITRVRRGFSTTSSFTRIK